MKVTSAFLVFVPKDKPLSYELSRGIRAPLEEKKIDGLLHLYWRRVHHRAKEEDRLAAVCYEAAVQIDDCKVFLCTAQRQVYGWFHSRYKTLPLTEAWRDPSIRLKLKKSGIQSQGEGIGRPVLPKTAPGVDLDKLEW